MARPKPAPALQARTRPTDHVFAPAAAEPVPEAPAAAASSRMAATAASHNGADAASRTAATETEPLVKFSIRVPPVQHKHIKVTATQQDMSIQDLAVTAIREYLERLGHPLP
jgi:hypothetical protein